MNHIGAHMYPSARPRPIGVAAVRKTWIRRTGDPAAVVVTWGFS